MAKLAQSYQISNAKFQALLMQSQIVSLQCMISISGWQMAEVTIIIPKITPEEGPASDHATFLKAGKFVFSRLHLYYVLFFIKGKKTRENYQ